MVFLSLMLCHAFHRPEMKRSAMAPNDASIQNDVAFQSLLSSQRELLNRLKSEQEIKTQQRKPKSRKIRRTSGTPFRDDFFNSQSNLSIGPQNFREEKFLHPQRLSIGTGSDNYILPDFELGKFMSDGSSSEAQHLLEGDEEIKTQKLGVDDVSSVHQRRRSTLRFLNYLFEKNDGRRASMDTVKQMESSEDQKAANGQRSADEVSDDDDDDKDYEDFKTQKLDVDDVSSVQQRRSSTLRFLHYLFEKNDGRRASMDTVKQMESNEDQKAANGQRSEADEESEDDDYDYGVDGVNMSDAFLLEEDIKTQKLDVDDVSSVHQRRSSTLRFLHYLFEKQEGRRASIDTVRQKENDEDQEVDDGQRREAEENSDDDYDVYIVDANDEDEDENDTGENDTQGADVTVVTVAEQVRRQLVVFESTMEETQNSQQAIHDWDRKMGLKRSHSKTMRLSCRSRKKLRAIVRKELSHLRGNFT